MTAHPPSVDTSPWH